MTWLLATWYHRHSIGRSPALYRRLCVAQFKFMVPTARLAPTQDAHPVRKGSLGFINIWMILVSFAQLHVHFAFGRVASCSLGLRWIPASHSSAVIPVPRRNQVSSLSCGILRLLLYTAYFAMVSGRYTRHWIDKATERPCQYRPRRWLKINATRWV